MKVMNLHRRKCLKNKTSLLSKTKGKKICVAVVFHKVHVHALSYVKKKLNFYIIQKYQ